MFWIHLEDLEKFKMLVMIHTSNKQQPFQIALCNHIAWHWLYFNNQCYEIQYQILRFFWFLQCFFMVHFLVSTTSEKRQSKKSIFRLHQLQYSRLLLLVLFVHELLVIWNWQFWNWQCSNKLVQNHDHSIWHWYYSNTNVSTFCFIASSHIFASLFDLMSTRKSVYVYEYALHPFSTDSLVVSSTITHHASHSVFRVLSQFCGLSTVHSQKAQRKQSTKRTTNAAHFCKIFVCTFAKSLFSYW